MRRRTLAPLIAVIVLIAIVALGPGTPVVRGWILGALQHSLATAGFDLKWDKSSGNVWRGVRLENVHLGASGADVDLDGVNVRYFLPSLLAGELPLSVDLAGLRGNLDLDRLTAAAGPTPGAGTPIRLRLRDLTIDDAKLAIAQVPYTLPSGSLSDVHVRQDGDVLQLGGTLRTAHGALTVEGDLDLGAGTFDGQVMQADATLAQQWWEGAVGGTVAGPIHVGSDGIRGDFTLSDGAVDAIGLEARDVHGKVTLRYPRITADVEGTALGGPVEAQGSVDIDARAWQAKGTGSPTLVEGARWIFRSTLPQDLRLPLDGDAKVAVAVHGWTSVTLDGTATATGSLAGLPLDDVETSFSLAPSSPLRVHGTGRFAGGAATADVAPSPRGMRITVGLRDAALLEGSTADASLDLVTTPAGPDGKLALTAKGELAGRHVTLAVDGGVDADGWQAFLSGDDGNGATVQGAVVLNEGRADGEVNVEDLALPSLSENVNVGLAIAGNVAELPLTLTLGGPGPLYLATAGMRLDADLRGSMTATLSGGTALSDIRGSLGPLSVTGTAGFAPVAADLTLQMAASKLAGPVHATLALADGRLTMNTTGIHHSGTWSLTDATVGPLAADPGAFQVEASLGTSGTDQPSERAPGAQEPGAQAPSAQVQSTQAQSTEAPGAQAPSTQAQSTRTFKLHAATPGDQLAIDLDGTDLRVKASAFAMTLQGTPVSADGTLDLGLAADGSGMQTAGDVLSRLRPDLNLTTAHGTLALTSVPAAGAADRTATDAATTTLVNTKPVNTSLVNTDPVNTNLVNTVLHLRPGFTLGPVSLAETVTASGTLDLGAGRADLAGTAGAMPLEATAVWGAGAAGGEGTPGAAEAAAPAPTAAAPAPSAPPATSPASLRVDLAVHDDQRTLALSAALVDGELKASAKTVGDAGAAAGFDVAPLTALVGWPGSGDLNADLRYGAAGYAGTARLDTRDPLPASITLQGDKSGALVLDASATAAGQALAATGTALPHLSLQARAGPIGPFTIDAAGVHGSGTTDAFHVGGGVAIEPLPWTLTGGAPASSPAGTTVGASAGNTTTTASAGGGAPAAAPLRDVTLDLGDGRVRLSLAGGPHLAARLSLPLDVRGQPWLLDLGLADATAPPGKARAPGTADARSPVPPAQTAGDVADSAAGMPAVLLTGDLAALAVAGTLRPASGAASADGLAADDVVTIGGTLGALKLDGRLPADVLARIVADVPALAGDVSFDATADLTAGPEYAVTGAWTVAPADAKRGTPNDDRPTAATATRAGDATTTATRASDATAPALDLSLSFRGTGARWTATAKGAGLDVDATPTRLALRFDQARLAGLLRDPPAGGTLDVILDGAMTRTTSDVASPAATSSAVKAATTPSSPTATDTTTASTTPPDAAAPPPSAAWEGAVKATLTGATSASVIVRGSGDRLTVDGEATPAGAHLELSGTVFPQPDVRLVGTALNDALTLSLASTGGWSDLGLTGTLNSAAVTDPLFTLPALSAAISWEAGQGPVDVTGEHVDLRLDPSGQVQGTLSIPFGLLDEAHALDLRLSGTLTDPQLQGTVAGPLLTAELQGNTSSGVQVALTSTEAGVAAITGRLLGGLPTALSDTLADGVSVHGNVSPDLTWHATATTKLSLPQGATASGGPLLLAAHLDGDKAGYAGAASLALVEGAAPLATLSVDGEGTDLQAQIDLGTVDWTSVGAMFGVPVDVDAAGSLKLSTRPASASLRFDASGKVAGADVTLGAGFGDGRPLNAQARWGALSVDLGQDAAGGYTLAAHGSQSLDLDGRLTLEPALSVALDGSLRGLPLSLSGGGDPGARTGALDARWGGATAHVDLEPSATGVAVTLDANAPAGATPFQGPRSAQLALAATVALPAGGPTSPASGPSDDASGSGSAATSPVDVGDPVGTGVRVDVSALRFTLKGAPTDLSVHLAGPAWPEAALRGTAAVAAVDRSFDLALDGTPASAELRLVSEGLTLSARSDGLSLAALALQGDGPVPLPPTMLGGVPVNVLSSDLSWVAAEGFQGSLQAAAGTVVAGVATDVRLNAAGSGPLRADVTAGPSDAGEAPSTWATATLSVSDDPLNDRRIEGSATLDLPLDPFVGSLVGAAAGTGAMSEGVDVRLIGSPTVTGSWDAPVIDGPLTLEGDVNASGTVTWGAGNGSVTLSGPGLDLTAAIAKDAWHAHVDVRDLDLDPFVPQVRGARLSLAADVDSAPGKPFVANVTTLDLTAPGARLHGSASLAEGLRVALRVEANLADVDTGELGLRGIVRGPLVLVAPSLNDLGAGNVTAVVEVAGLGVRAVDASVAGTLQLGGSPLNPLISGALVGTGDLTGALRLDAAPADDRFELSSTLAYGGFKSDLRVAIAQGTARASGNASFGDASVVFSDDDPSSDASALPCTQEPCVQRLGHATGDTPAGRHIHVDGGGRLEGWHAAMRSDLGMASIEGPLAALAGGGAALEGELHARVGGGAPWLEATLKGVAAGGQSIGDLTLTSDRAGAPLELAGVGIDASLTPATLAWEAALHGFALPAGLTLSGNATGRATSFDASLQLGGSFAGSPVAVDATLASGAGSGAGPLRVKAGGALLGGTLALDAHVATAEAPDATPGWTGSLALSGASVMGTTIDLEGAVAGRLLGPAWTGTVTTSGAVEGGGSLRAGVDGLAVDLNLDGPSVRTPLHVKGDLAPRLDVTITTPQADPTFGGRLRLTDDAGLRGTGTLSVTVAGIGLDVLGRGAAAPPRLTVVLPGPTGFAFTGVLPDADVAGIVARLESDGLVLNGTRATTGAARVRFGPEPSVELASVGLHYLDIGIRADGQVRLRNGTPQATLDAFIDLPVGWPVAGLSDGSSIPLKVDLDGSLLHVDARGPGGSLTADVDLAQRTGDLKAEADLGEYGSGTVALSLPAGAAADGTVRLHGITIATDGLPPLSLDADLDLASGRVSGDAALSGAGGSVRLSGRWGLAGVVPDAWAGTAPSGGDAEVRVSTFDLAALPTLARRAPHLSGNVSGVAQLRGSSVVGQLLAPMLEVAGTPLPADLQVSGTLAQINARLTLGGSLATATLGDGHVAGLMRFERFPAQVIAEASTGKIDVSADATGVLRFDLPFADPASGYLRIATEEVQLERAGVVTTGNVALSYQDGAFNVEQASFEGQGTWQADGSVSADGIDFRMQAEDADFGPLLGLVPTLARFGVAAKGSLSLVAKGTVAEPDIRLNATDIAASIAGLRYRVEGTSVTLAGRDLSAHARVVGLQPVQGSIDLEGSARLLLAPLAIRDTDFHLSGGLDVPLIGSIGGLDGNLAQESAGPARLDVTGTLGAPFSLHGTLAPLDLRFTGTGLSAAVPQFFISSSTFDAELRLTGERSGVALGGSLAASEVKLDLGARGSAASAPASAAADAAAPSSERSAADARSAKAALEAVHFDGLRITAPQRVLLNLGIASAEAGLDLTLSGTAAAPALDGQARSLRGSMRFAGRDFTLDRAVASFAASRGAYPTLDVVAHSDFDKQRALSGLNGARFVAPSEGSRFRVTLAFSGQVEASDDPSTPVRFDITPTLTSDALIEEPAAAGQPALGARPLTDAELYSLITLGRVDLQAGLGGEAGIGTAVAQSAIDTAIDLLVVSELQNALSQALGIDVVEIRTTAVSSLLDESGQPFGVSLRLGGYLTPELFASYKIGTYDDSGASAGLSNEVSFSYDLGPFELDLSGRLSFPNAATLSGPQPALGAGIRYDFTRNLGLETGVDLASDRQVARFGVTLRW